MGIDEKEFELVETKIDKIRVFDKAEDLTYFETFFPIETKSELSKCLTKEIWEEYKDMKCD